MYLYGIACSGWFESFFFDLRCLVRGAGDSCFVFSTFGFLVFIKNLLFYVTGKGGFSVCQMWEEIA